MTKGVSLVLVLCGILNCFLADASHAGKNITRLRDFIVKEKIYEENPEDLDFADNLLLTIENARIFENFTQLLTLNLDRNVGFHLLRENKPGLECRTLLKFSCDECNITEIRQKTFSKLPKLTILSLNGNGMKEIEADAFESNVQLEELSLRGNEFVELPEKLVVDVPVRSLFFDNNSLYDFPRGKPFVISKSLKIFTCSACGITAIYEETFAQLPQLEILNLHHNSIHHIHDGTFIGAATLQSLNVEFNALTDVPLKAIEAMDELKEVCLDGNPIKWSQDFEIFNQLDKKRHFHGESCNRNESLFLNKTIIYPKAPTESTKIPSTTEISDEQLSVNPTLLDALIATYLLVCVILEGVLIVFISLYLAKIVRSKPKEFDYSTCVFNPSDIYKIN